MEHGARGSENSNTLGYELNSAGHSHAFTVSPTARSTLWDPGLHIPLVSLTKRFHRRGR